MKKWKQFFLEVFVSWQGRMPRREFWAFQVLAIIPFVVWSVLTEGITEGVAWYMSKIIAVFLLWPLLAVHVKRCHDRNRGWSFIFVPYLPFFGTLWYLVEIGFLPGTSINNRFGLNPLAEGGNDEPAATSLPAISSFCDALLVLLPLYILLFLVGALVNLAPYESYKRGLP
jgi:uncharacterized membrane protein YhaH (DUF805 family)